MRNGLGQLLGKGFGHRFLYEQAVGTNAGLPCIPILGSDGSGDRRVQVGIVEYDERGIPSEFQR